MFNWRKIDWMNTLTTEVRLVFFISSFKSPDPNVNSCLKIPIVQDCVVWDRLSGLILRSKPCWENLLWPVFSKLCFASNKQFCSCFLWYDLFYLVKSSVSIPDHDLTNNDLMYTYLHLLLVLFLLYKYDILFVDVLCN